MGYYNLSKVVGFNLTTRAYTFIPREEPENENEKKFIALFSQNVTPIRIWSIIGTLKSQGLTYLEIEESCKNVSIRAIKHNFGSICGDVRKSINEYFTTYSSYRYMSSELSSNIGKSWLSFIFLNKNPVYSILTFYILVFLASFSLYRNRLSGDKFLFILLMILIIVYSVLISQIDSRELCRRFDIVRIFYLIFVLMTLCEIIKGNNGEVKKEEVINNGTQESRREY